MEQHPTYGFPMLPCVRCKVPSVHAAVAESRLCLGCTWDDSCLHEVTHIETVLGERWLVCDECWQIVRKVQVIT